MRFPKKWIIRKTGPDDYEVLHGSKLLRSDASHAAALRYVRRHRNASERVYLEDEDGYRTEITEQS